MVRPEPGWAGGGRGESPVETLQWRVSTGTGKKGETSTKKRSEDEVRDSGGGGGGVEGSTGGGGGFGQQEVIRL